MAEWNDRTLAYRGRLSSGRPEPDGESDRRLDIAVVFTFETATVAALRKAAVLADQLRARIVLVAPQIVPFPLPLESPPVLLEFSERRFRHIAEESGVETAVCIYLCRERLATLKLVLPARRIVVIGGRRRWWPTQEKRLARQLRRAGYEVVFEETE